MVELGRYLVRAEIAFTQPGPQADICCPSRMQEDQRLLPRRVGRHRTSPFGIVTAVMKAMRTSSSAPSRLQMSALMPPEYDATLKEYIKVLDANGVSHAVLHRSVPLTRSWISSPGRRSYILKLEVEVQAEAPVARPSTASLEGVQV
jgi:hypothetical protein